MQNRFPKQEMSIEPKPVRLSFEMENPHENTTEPIKLPLQLATTIDKNIFNGTLEPSCFTKLSCLNSKLLKSNIRSEYHFFLNIVFPNRINSWENEIIFVPLKQ